MGYRVGGPEGRRKMCGHIGEVIWGDRKRNLLIGVHKECRKEKGGKGGWGKTPFF